ncbi:MAG: cytochrome c peroxidase [Verrucomicrobiota bacterium]
MGVEASSRDYSTKIMIRWEPVAFANEYRIYRNTTNSSASASLIAVSDKPYVFDTGTVAEQAIYYWVRAANDSEESELSEVVVGVRALGITDFGDQEPLNPPEDPAGNPLTASKVALGKTLFWEEQMSSTGTMSCATCHAPTAGGSDARSVIGDLRSSNPGPDGVVGTNDDVTGSQGVPANTHEGLYTWSEAYAYDAQVTVRYPRPAINAGYTETLFWDGRAGSQLVDPVSGETVLTNGAALEVQALGPITNDVEMAHMGANWEEILAKLERVRPLALATDIPTALEAWISDRGYPELFLETFGDSEITPSRIAMAIASYERILFSDRTKFDRVVMGIDAFSNAETRGQNRFNGSRCDTCHSGPAFTDGDFHHIGVRPIANGEDLGRFDVTGNNGDRGDFLTPGLRNAALRPAFMHTGSIGTLEEVIDFYIAGGDFNSADNELRPVNLAALAQADLLAFLETLTDDRVANALPPFDHPTLYAGSGREPSFFGTGNSGQGGVTPQFQALEPPLVGNPSFTVGVVDGRPGAQATFVMDITEPSINGGVPSAAEVACRFTISLENSGDGAGSGSVSIEIPDDPTLVGQTLYGRWFIEDEDAVGGYSCTPSFAMTLFGEGGVDGETGYDAWAQLLAAEISATDPTDDPDGDSLTNLEEYFASTDAASPDNPSIEKGYVTIDGETYMTMTFTRRQFTVDIEPVIEFSEDLLSWSTLEGSLAEVGDPISNGDGTETITVRSLSSVAETTRQFLRLRLVMVDASEA